MRIASGSQRSRISLGGFSKASNAAARSSNFIISCVSGAHTRQAEFHSAPPAAAAVIYSSGGAFGDLHLHAVAWAALSHISVRLIKRLFAVARVGDARWECCGVRARRTPPIHTLLQAAEDDGSGYRDLALYGSIALARINSPLVAARTPKRRPDFSQPDGVD